MLDKPTVNYVSKSGHCYAHFTTFECNCQPRELLLFQAGRTTNSPSRVGDSLEGKLVCLYTGVEESH